MVVDLGKNPEFKSELPQLSRENVRELTLRALEMLRAEAPAGCSLTGPGFTLTVTCPGGRSISDPGWKMELHDEETDTTYKWEADSLELALTPVFDRSQAKRRNVILLSFGEGREIYLSPGQISRIMMHIDGGGDEAPALKLKVDTGDGKATMTIDGGEAVVEVGKSSRYTIGLPALEAGIDRVRGARDDEPAGPGV